MSISHSCPIDCSSGSYGCHDLEVWLLQGLTKEILAQSITRFDLIIDDGPHTDEAILATFKELFPLISDLGYYVVEDNLSVKRELAALAIKFGGLMKRKGDLLVVTKITQ